jgi:acid phosphatase type 7
MCDLFRHASAFNLFLYRKERMRIKYSDTQPLPKTHGPHQISFIAKIFIAVVLISVVILNVSSVLPVMTPVKVDNTPQVEPKSTLTFKADADAQVEENNPAINPGTSGDLEVVNVTGQSIESYMRFTVSGISGDIQNARLRVYSTTDAAEDGPALYATDNDWTETEIIWNDRPARAGSEIGNQDLVRRYSWVEYDVTAVVTGNGTYSFVLVGDNDEELRFSSRESSNGPELILTLASATPTAASEATPNATAGNTLTFPAAADAHIAQRAPTANHGTSTDLQADGNTNAVQISYIRFSVSGINGSIQNVKLRVFPTSGTQDGPAAHFADSSWKETGADGITWTARPTLLSGPIDNKEAMPEGSWVEYDVTAAVTGDGTYTFALVADSQDEVTFSSREGKEPPQLIVTTGLTAPTPTPRPVSQGSPGDVILVGAGDIATCDREEDELTAQLLDSLPGTVFTLGDNAYVNGSYSEYINCYEPTWGRHKSRTKPVPGNHEYNTSGAAGYFQYFNNVPSYYAYNLGSWRIYALNSEIDSSLSSPQVIWLVEDLAANPSQCALAYWHTPRWSSGAKNGSQPTLQSIWEILYDAGAELVINGHEHNYERFAEMDGSGAEVSQGLREIVVGTGGAGLYEFGTPLDASQIRDNSTFGVLKLTLHSTGYDWEFVPVPNSTFTDSGSSNCH